MVIESQWISPSPCAGRLDGRIEDRVGYEIDFNRYFYIYTAPRPLAEIEGELKQIKRDIADMLAEVTE